MNTTFNFLRNRIRYNGAPVLRIQSIPLGVVRCSFHLPPRACWGRRGATRRQSSSLSSCRRIHGPPRAGPRPMANIGSARRPTCDANQVRNWASADPLDRT